MKTISKQIDRFFNILNHVNSVKSYFEPIIQQVSPQYLADAHSAKVIGLTHISVNTFTLILKPSQSWGLFTPGDHVPVHIMKDGTWYVRYFTIASSVQHFRDTGLIELCIRSQKSSGITQFMKDTLQAGMSVNLSKASGEFHLHENIQEKTLMIAGGSGITPFRSMLQQLSLRSEYRSNITLLYYARKDEEFLFRQEFENMSAQGIVDVHFINSQSQGRFCEAHIKAYCPDALNRQVYVCGPGSMIEDAKTSLIQQGLKPTNLHYEFFGPHISAQASNSDTQGAEFSVQFKTSQTRVNAPSSESLLTVAQQSGLNPVFGCGMGVCHQCICKKQSGVVRNIKTGKLSDQGPEEIQLCISQAHSDLELEL